MHHKPPIHAGRKSLLLLLAIFLSCFAGAESNAIQHETNNRVDKNDDPNSHRHLQDCEILQEPLSFDGVWVVDITGSPSGILNQLDVFEEVLRSFFSCGSDTDEGNIELSDAMVQTNLLPFGVETAPSGYQTLSWPIYINGTTNLASLENFEEFFPSDSERIEGRQRLLRQQSPASKSASFGRYLQTESGCGCAPPSLGDILPALSTVLSSSFPISNVDGLAETEEQDCPIENTSIRSSISIEVQGRPSLITARSLQRLANGYAVTYNDLNRLGGNICDTSFRTVTKAVAALDGNAPVTPVDSAGDEKDRRVLQNATSEESDPPSPSPSTSHNPSMVASESPSMSPTLSPTTRGPDLYSILITLEGECKGCTVEGSFFDQLTSRTSDRRLLMEEWKKRSLSFSERLDWLSGPDNGSDVTDGLIFGSDRLLQEGDGFESGCFCAKDAELDVEVTTDIITELFDDRLENDPILQDELPFIEETISWEEVTVFDCDQAQFESIAAADFAGDLNSLSKKEIKKIEKLFLKSFNRLSENVCDPLFRTVSKVEAVQVRAATDMPSMMPTVSATSAPTLLANRRLFGDLSESVLVRDLQLTNTSETELNMTIVPGDVGSSVPSKAPTEAPTTRGADLFALVFVVTGECNGCSTDAALFDALTTRRKVKNDIGNSRMGNTMQTRKGKKSPIRRDLGSDMDDQNTRSTISRGFVSHRILQEDGGISGKCGCKKEAESVGVPVEDFFEEFSVEIEKDEDIVSVEKVEKTEELEELPPTPFPTTSPYPSVSPSRVPSIPPSVSFEPTVVPTSSMRPTLQPSKSNQPTSTALPTQSSKPTMVGSGHPSQSPSTSSRPTDHPSAIPSMTSGPTSSFAPSIKTMSPSSSPSVSSSPTGAPSFTLSPTESSSPTVATESPSMMASVAPSVSAKPSVLGSESPSATPTSSPSVSGSPTMMKSDPPSDVPSEAESLPTLSPSMVASMEPSGLPSMVPTTTPTKSLVPTIDGATGEPTLAPTTSFPTLDPSISPTLLPTPAPSTSPSVSPSASPSTSPSTSPSASPIASPSAEPTMPPSASPSTGPTVAPTVLYTDSPSASPTIAPSARPTTIPSNFPTPPPSSSPTLSPSRRPSNPPSYEPSSFPTIQPSNTPVSEPSSAPSFSPTQCNGLGNCPGTTDFESHSFSVTLENGSISQCTDDNGNSKSVWKIDTTGSGRVNIRFGCCRGGDLRVFLGCSGHTQYDINFDDLNDSGIKCSSDVWHGEILSRTHLETSIEFDGSDGVLFFRVDFGTNALEEWCTSAPSSSPSNFPSHSPSTSSPSGAPSNHPTSPPTSAPTTDAPSYSPTKSE